ncbi:hypothetical protein DID88_004107 [Monilinia fructigena]|uniref:Uncharacterized protein n=1 Tax=Monilinia fructigena TaxID=38457 RepID=A0A395IS89_9HELO|nr:hypothetical protein DID88_004107 [Monilinia fructigena]
MSSPARRSPASPTFPEAPKESAVVRFIIAPIPLSHSSYPSSSSIGAIVLFDFINILSPPQPYAYIKSPYRGQNAEGDKQREEEPWHWRTKQKKMMKMEVSDAFKLRQWVLVGMAVVATMLGLLLLYLGNLTRQIWV